MFGPSVTTAGLVAAADWLAVLQKSPKTNLIILPRQTVNADKVFLDDMSARQLSRMLAIPVKFARSPLEAAKLIRQFMKDKTRMNADEKI